ncbi:Hypothetical Protein FCC1311_090682 [Hondaea fermentalgiana]|uniref:Uncharacterized protein n=1 Tax=Hondaea fermentalgiana TaxID=2315210 RepID=A0A2R5GVZ7_9STRA|nr:Hypothetical Protein FCC1311_090682 [Hondaea fermentalgiana]|eukprot:GBG32843.1 Hypothetical Protein FCC1311_090682 [Hondaea fermentalgiana]
MSSLVLAALAGCTGVASASLAVSAYGTLLPVLATGFGIHVLDALFVCFVVDCVNGALVCARYRQRLTARTIWPMLSGACIAVTAAVLVATSFGIELLRSHEGKLKGGVAITDFIMGFGFMVRYYRHRNGSIPNSDTASMDMGSALLHHEDEAVELIESESTTSYDANEDLHEHNVGALEDATPSADVVIEASDDESEGGDHDEAGVPSTRLPASRTNAEDDAFVEIMDEVLEDEASCVKTMLTKARIFTLGVAEPKTCFTFLYLAFLGSLSGMIGFGGGNAFAIYYIIVYKWSTITATCASAFISGFMTFGLLVCFLASGVVHLDQIVHLLIIALPCDMAAVLLTSHYAKNMSEQAICFLVSMLFFGIGTFVVIFSAVHGPSANVPP